LATRGGALIGAQEHGTSKAWALVVAGRDSQGLRPCVGESCVQCVRWTACFAICLHDAITLGPRRHLFDNEVKDSESAHGSNSISKLRYSRQLVKLVVAEKSSIIPHEAEENNQMVDK
ncbi:unnamed protein product, partial [Ectocarpus sp. 6 AP-2014]